MRRVSAGKKMMLVIGCGNTDRGDDGAGILVARRLRSLGVDAVDHAGDGFDLLDLWESAEDVALMDAMVSGSEPGRVAVWDGLAAPLSAKACRCSTHMFGPAEAIELGRALGRLPKRLRIYGIEGAKFELGAEPTPEVMAAVDRVAGEILSAVRLGAADGQHM